MATCAPVRDRLSASAPSTRYLVKPRRSPDTAPNPSYLTECAASLQYSMQYTRFPRWFFKAISKAAVVRIRFVSTTRGTEILR